MKNNALQNKHRSIDSLREDDFTAISEYYSTGESVALTEKQQEILERLRTAHAILRKYPRKSVAILKLQARYPDLSREQAFVDVRNACRLWNKYDPIDRDFLEGWFLDWLMKEIANPASSDTARAKNMSTLQKYLALHPPVQIDPRLMESNQIFIQFNVNGRTMTLPIMPVKAVCIVTKAKPLKKTSRTKALTNWMLFWSFANNILHTCRSLFKAHATLPPKIH
jgi:hypothetical protein